MQAVPEVTPVVQNLWDIGQRQDICPHPKANFCYKCGSEGDTEAHDCQPKCKICGEEHVTASIERKKKLRSNGSSLITLAPESIAGVLVQMTSSSLHRDPGRSLSHSKQKRSSGCRTLPRSRSATRITYAAAVSGSYGCSSQHTTSASDISLAETAEIRELENKVQELQRTARQRPPAECGTPYLEDRILRQVEASIMKRVEERLQIHEAKVIDLVERCLLAFEETLTTKLLASLDGFIAQQHNFMTYAYKNFVTHEQLAERSGTKCKERKTVGEDSAADVRSTVQNDRQQAEVNCQHGGSQM
ncbi:hypothetical protein HPB52_021344 [Rhipicephalus sanguineus]|uniref:CCHC-type domain-containing protein n=1 Tax=Rhipicephalus sanguineus TaxID=34632 RepID=A0A9D4SN96_RHISA|nr:hypothetical protein HPB52_021344 [Rhipicephalus sanguineus]